MGKVLKSDATVTGYSYVEADLGSPQTDVWVTFRLAFTADALAWWLLGNGDPLLDITDAGGSHEVDSLIVDTSSAWINDYGFSGGTATAETWQTLEYHYHESVVIELYVDGVSAFSSGAGLFPIAAQDFLLGQVGVSTAPNLFVYIGDVKIGTTRGGTDLFADDFSSGNLSAWTSTTGDVSVVDDPFPPTPPTTLAGVSIAFDNNALDDPVTWTRIDNLDGVHITGITVDRGRTDERSKTVPGAVTISGIDSNGTLDPTNPSGPFYGKLDPVKQASVTLFNPVTDTWNYIFRGYIAEIINDLDVSENFSNFQIELVDMLDLINDSEIIPDSAGNMVPTENIGDSFYTGQHCDDRQFAVLADTATAFGGGVWPVSLLQLASGNVFVQGRAYSNQTSLLQVIDEAADAEGVNVANRFITKAGAYAFRGRYYRYVTFIANDGIRRPGKQMLHWRISDIRSWSEGSSMSVCNSLKFQRGKTNLINSALVTPVGIKTEDIAGKAVHDSTSIEMFGPRTSGMSLENLIMSHADDGNNSVQEAKTYAEAIVKNYSYPVTYVSEIMITNPLENTGDAATNTWFLLTNVELSDLVTVHTQHPGGGGFDGVDYFIEKINYQIAPLDGDIWQVALTLNMTPRSYYAFMPASWTPPSETGITASFSYTFDGGTGVTFTDTSTPGPSGPITSWLWSFGDGSTSTLQNPVHTYASTSAQAIELTVTGTGADGSDSTFTTIIFPT